MHHFQDEKTSRLEQAGQAGQACAALARESVPERQAKILGIDPIGSHTLRLMLRLLPDEAQGSMAEFEPGQFVELELPGEGVRRTYFLANTPNWEGRLEFLIQRWPGGRFSGWLEREARIGEGLRVRGPEGAFGINPTSLRPRWLVADATGLAAALSILRRMAEFQEMHPVRLYFGAEREDALFCREELASLQARLPLLRVTLCLELAGDDWCGFRGTPAAALAEDLATAGTPPDLYLCGSSSLVDAATEAAQAAGIPPQQIVGERFSAS